MSYKFSGKHLMAELYDIELSLLNDHELVEKAIKEGVIKSKSTLLSIKTEYFEPQGFTLAGILAESHTTVHTYPEKKALFFDAFTCGNSDPEKILDELVKVLKPSKVNKTMINRGEQ